MLKVVQGTISPGFGGLEMVIIEFHEWLLSQNIEAYVLVYDETPICKALLQRGHQATTIAVKNRDWKDMISQRKRFDSRETALLFHRQQGLKILRFRKFQAKISMLSHTFYDVRKNDFWHRMIFKKVDQWIALTELHKANLIQYCGIAAEKIKIIPNGVDLNTFTPLFRQIPSADQTVHIGVIARLDPQKGQDIALQALANICKTSPLNCQLHFFGEGTPNEQSPEKSLRELANRLGVNDRTWFRGFHQNIQPAIRGLDILWMPSKKETFGRSLIEAMASGIPVIASNAGGVPDIIEHSKNGLLFESMNAFDLAEKTKDLLANNILFENLRRQARKDVETRFDQEQSWPLILKAIQPAPEPRQIQNNKFRRIVIP